MHRLRNVFQLVNLITARPDQTVLEVAQAMTEGRIGAIPVLQGEKLVGIFSERDLMTRVIVAGLDAADTLIADVMTREVVTAALDERVDTCLEMMQKVGCRHLPVMDEGRVISVISIRDLMRDELEERGDEIRSLRAYLHQTPT